jgi:hypothetical protein
MREVANVQPESYVEIIYDSNSGTLTIRPLMKSEEGLLIEMAISIDDLKKLGTLFDTVAKEGAEVKVINCSEKGEDIYSCRMILHVLDRPLAESLRRAINEAGLSVIYLETIGRSKYVEP